MREFGHQISDYILLQIIGEGGFSRVFQVRSKHDGNIYAMKVMKKSKVMREIDMTNLVLEK